MTNTNSFINVPDLVNADFALINQGDSMVNARIANGDIVCFNKQSSIENGSIFAVEIDGSILLRRIYNNDDCIILQAENPAFSPIFIKKEKADKLQVLGKAIYSINNIL